MKRWWEETCRRNKSLEEKRSNKKGDRKEYKNEKYGKNELWERWKVMIKVKILMWYERKCSVVKWNYVNKGERCVDKLQLRNIKRKGKKWSCTGNKCN